MKKVLLMVLMFFSLNCAFAAVTPADLKAAQEVVKYVQTIPHLTFLCLKPDYTADGRGESEGARDEYVKPILSKFLTQRLLKFFLQANCGSDRFLEKYYDTDNEPNAFSMDPRFGLGYMAGTADPDIPMLMERIRVQPPKADWERADEGGRLDVIKVNVLYDYYGKKNIKTSYVMKKEDGVWKIMDMAPQGLEIGDSYYSEQILYGTKSVEEVWGVAYLRAEDKYKAAKAARKK